jgi:hypothetical protein
MGEDLHKIYPVSASRVLDEATARGLIAAAVPTKYNIGGEGGSSGRGLRASFSRLLYGESGPALQDVWLFRLDSVPPGVAGGPPKGFAVQLSGEGALAVAD